VKSGRQRRIEIQNKRANARDKAKAATRETVLASLAMVNSTLLKPTNSYGIPDFVQRGYYLDRPFTCKDCGKAEIWRAKQQKWWYETAQGDVWTVAVRCRLCRRRERERITRARAVSVAGLKNKVSKL
jgi:hypothetical protein